MRSGRRSARSALENCGKSGSDGRARPELFYGVPSAGNPQAGERFEQNRFTVVRQLRYSGDDAQRALDIGLFSNGLSVCTLELKNSLTKQTLDAVGQDRRDRNPREKLFELVRWSRKPGTRECKTGVEL